MTRYTLRAVEPADRPVVTALIPEFGHDGIPVRDELDLEFRLS